MNSTLNIVSVSSVYSNFSWDNEVYDFSNTIVPTLSVTITNDTIPIYVGYAPTMFVALTSQVTKLSADDPNISHYLVRKIDFGDYYNEDTNTIILTGIDGLSAFHTYVMPGTYTVYLVEAEYEANFDNNATPLSNNTFTFQTNPDMRIASYLSGVTCDDGTVLDNSTVNINSVSASFVLTVVEIPPTAYLYSPDLSTKDPLEYTFPLTIRLTPKYSQTGSFPIDKVIWDLGDGSPQFVKRRWDNNTTLSATSAAEFPYFVYNGARPGDVNDPRNYDVIHTYTATKQIFDTLYPSITVVTSSTSSTDTAAYTVGPISSPLLKDNITLLQSELRTDGKVIIGQVGTDISVWKTQ